MPAAEQVEGHLRARHVRDDEVPGRAGATIASGEHPVDRRRRPSGRLDDQRCRARLLGVLEPGGLRVHELEPLAPGRARRAAARPAASRSGCRARGPRRAGGCSSGPARQAASGTASPRRSNRRRSPPAATERITSLTVAPGLAAGLASGRRAPSDERDAAVAPDLLVEEGARRGRARRRRARRTPSAVRITRAGGLARHRERAQRRLARGAQRGADAVGTPLADEQQLRARARPAPSAPRGSASRSPRGSGRG